MLWLTIVFSYSTTQNSISSGKSLIHVYHMKSAFVDKWKKTDFLSLVADKQLNLPSYSVFDMTTCELIPLESIELWIYFSYLLCYSAFSQSTEVTAMWKRVLTFNFTLTLFRDETIDIFKTRLQFFYFTSLVDF